ncbi:MAG: hypothetical protein AB7N24_23410 [Dehalococcoidia bacterium]
MRRPGGARPDDDAAVAIAPHQPRLADDPLRAAGIGVQRAQRQERVEGRVAHEAWADLAEQSVSVPRLVAPQALPNGAAVAGDT